MSLHVLAVGTLHKDPVRRTSQSGKPFVTASLKVADGSETVWASLICFDTTAQEELLRLRAGDACSISGKAKLSVFEKNGEHRASLDITASAVLPLKPKAKTRKPATAATPPAGAQGAPDPDFDDEIPI